MVKSDHGDLPTDRSPIALAQTDKVKPPSRHGAEKDRAQSGARQGIAKSLKILASRDDLTSEENRQRHTALKNDVRKAGYGFIDVEGRNVDEKSLLVVGKMGDDKGHLLGHLKHLATKYNQDSILHKPHNSEKTLLHGTNETGYPGKDKHIEVGSWHANRTAEFHR